MIDRIKRVNDLLRERIAVFLTVQLELDPGVLVTVTRVDTSRNLASAKVFLSVYPQTYRGSVLEKLRHLSADLTAALAGELKLYRLPRWQFLIDASEDKATRIFDLLDQIEEKR